ncbi:hypothetical protein, partial [Campylobacter lari]
TTECLLEGGVAGRDEYVRSASGSVVFAPDRHGRFRQQGACESLSLALRPDVLHNWLAEDLDQSLRRS